MCVCVCVCGGGSGEDGWRRGESTRVPYVGMARKNFRPVPSCSLAQWARVQTSHLLLKSLIKTSWETAYLPLP